MSHQSGEERASPPSTSGASNNNNNSGYSNKTVVGLPLDLAKSASAAPTSTTTVLTNQAFRGMRVVTHNNNSNNSNNTTANAISSSTIITTNIVPHAVFKQGTSQNQHHQSNIITTSSTSATPSGSIPITIQRPTQITLSTVPNPQQSGVSGGSGGSTTTYHVPRGPAVVANLAAPRNTTLIAGGAGIMASQSTVAGQFIRPPRAPSPSTVWLNKVGGGTNALPNSTILQNTQLIRSTGIISTGGTTTTTTTTANTINNTNKQLNVTNTTAITVARNNINTSGGNNQVVQRTGAIGMGGNTTTTILHNAITIGHPFKASVAALQSGGGGSGGTTTIGLGGGARLTVNSASAGIMTSRQGVGVVSTKPISSQVAARLTIPTPVGTSNISNNNTGSATAAATINSSRILVPAASLSSSAQSQTLSAAARITPIITGGATIGTGGGGSGATITARGNQQQSSVTISRLSMVTTGTGGGGVGGSQNILGIGATGTRNTGTTTTLNLHPLHVAMAAINSNNNNNGSGATTTRVVAQKNVQSTQGAIHFTPISPNIKGQSVATVSTRTINIPAAAIMAQRSNSSTPTTSTSSTTLPIVPIATANIFTSHHQQQSHQQHIDSSHSIPVHHHHSLHHPLHHQQQQQQQQTNVFISGQLQTIRSGDVRRGSPRIVSGQQVRLNAINSIMVMDRNQEHFINEFESHQQQQQNLTTTTLPVKVTSSPRPSILRKRDHDTMVSVPSSTLTTAATTSNNNNNMSTMSSLKAAKNLIATLENTNLNNNQQQQQNMEPVSPPSRPESRDNGHTSGGSTTISATSSPGLGELNEDSMPSAPPIESTKNEDMTKMATPKTTMTVEMSPRKKPRKQQLVGNDIVEKSDDIEFLSENNNRRRRDDIYNASQLMLKTNEDQQQSIVEPLQQLLPPPLPPIHPLKDGAPEAKQMTTLRKPASASLLNTYKQNWKATHNHYSRYSDVRPKDEKRPTIMDLANQCKVQDKLNGWKVYHLSSQMEDLAEQENSVYNQLSDLLKTTESQNAPENNERDINTINELIKGNLQRIKIINDGMVEAKSQIMKVFDHKIHVSDIINRCASKRNFKKREKS